MILNPSVYHPVTPASPPAKSPPPPASPLPEDNPKNSSRRTPPESRSDKPPCPEIRAPPTERRSAVNALPSSTLQCDRQGGRSSSLHTSQKIAAPTRDFPIR